MTVYKLTKKPKEESGKDSQIRYTDFAKVYYGSVVEGRLGLCDHCLRAIDGDEPVIGTRKLGYIVNVACTVCGGFVMSTTLEELKEDYDVMKI